MKDVQKLSIIPFKKQSNNSPEIIVNESEYKEPQSPIRETYLEINPTENNWIRKSVKNVQGQKEELMKIGSLNRRKSSLIKLDDKKEEDIKNKLKEEKERVDEVKKEYSLGFCLYFKKFICKGKLNQKEFTKVSIYEFAMNFVLEKMDIISYMNLQSNFDKYQLFNFNKIQKLTFKNLRKPNLMVKEDLELFDLDFSEDKDNNEKMKESEIGEQNLKIIKYFTQKLKGEGLDETDEKLYDFLHPKFKNIIADESCTG